MQSADKIEGETSIMSSRRHSPSDSTRVPALEETTRPRLNDARLVRPGSRDNHETIKPHIPIEQSQGQSRYAED